METVKASPHHDQSGHGEENHLQHNDDVESADTDTIYLYAKYVLEHLQKQALALRAQMQGASGSQPAERKELQSTMLLLLTLHKKLRAFLLEAVASSEPRRDVAAEAEAVASLEHCLQRVALSCQTLPAAGTEGGHPTGWRELWLLSVGLLSVPLNIYLPVYDNCYINLSECLGPV